MVLSLVYSFISLLVGVDVITALVQHISNNTLGHEITLIKRRVTPAHQIAYYTQTGSWPFSYNNRTTTRYDKLQQVVGTCKDLLKEKVKRRCR